MTPQEKAESLFDTFVKAADMDFKIGRRCALIAVDEILKSDPLSPSEFDKSIDGIEAYKNCESDAYKYWQEVKQAINNL